MLKHWLQPPAIAEDSSRQYAARTVGGQLLPTSYRRRDLKPVQIAIIGLDGELAEKTRTVLYKMSWPFGELGVMDLGNLRSSGPEFLTQLLRELISGGIVPLLIGDQADSFRAQYQAFQQLKPQVSLLMIDQRVQLSPEKARVAPGQCLNPAVYKQRQKLYHLAHIGAQQQLVDPQIFELFAQKHYDYLRLGTARHDLSQAEPLLRDADLAGFDLAAIRASDAPAQTGNNPSGFFMEEAAQLCRYAGISDKIRSFGIYGFCTSAGPGPEDGATRPDWQLVQTATAAAQLIWYFCDGFHNRWGDFPASNKGLTEYIVESPSYEQLTFWKSGRSGRWWVQSPVFNRKGEERHRLIPCSYQDYEAATKGEIPERLLQSFRR